MKVQSDKFKTYTKSSKIPTKILSAPKNKSVKSISQQQPIAKKTERKPGEVETPRFKLGFTFNHTLPESKCDEEMIHDISQDYFSFGESKSQNQSQISQPNNSVVTQKKVTQKDPVKRDFTKKSNVKPGPMLNNSFAKKNALGSSHSKSKSFHLDGKKNDTSQQSIQIFNNNYNIINISQEKKESIKHLKKQFEKILESQQKIETKVQQKSVQQKKAATNSSNQRIATVSPPSSGLNQKVVKRKPQF